jgi:protein-S-isoprenylcysteine O-methyltransferase Ste14
MYVGMVGLLLGFGLLAGSWLFGAAAIVFVLVVHFGVVLPEERYMESLHGEAYRQFMSKVRRWL